MPTFSKDNNIDYLSTSSPPQSPELEEAVLGSAFLDDESLYTILEQLQEEDFYYKKNQLIFSAIKSLFENSTGVDVQLVEDYLRDNDQLDVAGGSSYISGLTRSIDSLAKIEDKCQKIAQKHYRRDAIQGFQKLTALAADPSVDFNEVLSKADDIVFKLFNDDRAGNTHQAEHYITKAYQQIINRQGSPDGITGVGTGTDIDQVTAGWQSGEFIVIAARPSMGKTALMLQGMKYAAREYGAAAVLSLEMSHQGLGERMLIAEAGISGQRARKGQLYEEELEKLNEAAARLKDIGLIIDDTTFVSASRLRAKARSMIHKYDIQVLAVDYVQLLTSDKDNREQQVAEISRTCKAIAKEYGIPVIGLSQLNRSCESRRGWDKRPQLSDLRESGAIEQDADVVAFLFRPMYYSLKEYPDTGYGQWAGESTQNICEVLIAKNRNGPTGMRRLGFEESETRFYKVTPDTLSVAMKKAREQKEKYDTPF